MLHEERFYLEAKYIGGYTVECALKAIILYRTLAENRAETPARITSGSTMHRVYVLLNELRSLGMILSIEFVSRLRRFDWSTDLRYETGRHDKGETKAFLKTARYVYNWVESQLP